MPIGQLAAKAGINVQTIRFHRNEFWGNHLKSLPVTVGYRPRDLEELGFTPKEIQQLMKLHRPVIAMGRRQ
jgi:DNA-binding transcriptional MerR regulator